MLGLVTGVRGWGCCSGRDVAEPVAQGAPAREIHPFPRAPRAIADCLPAPTGGEQPAYVLSAAWARIGVTLSGKAGERWDPALYSLLPSKSWLDSALGSGEGCRGEKGGGEAAEEAPPHPRRGERRREGDSGKSCSGFLCLQSAR